MESDTLRGNVTKVLDAVTSATNGKVLDYSNNTNITFQIVGSDTSVGTVSIEASLDNTNWTSISDNAFAADGSAVVSISGQAHKYLRVNVSAYTSGTFNANMVRQSK